MSSATLAAASSCILWITWDEVSMMIPMLEWPSLSVGRSSATEMARSVLTRLIGLLEVLEAEDEAEAPEATRPKPTKCARSKPGEQSSVSGDRCAGPVGVRAYRSGQLAEMHHPVGVDVDDLSHGECIVMPGNDVGAGADARRISGLVEEGPR